MHLVRVNKIDLAYSRVGQGTPVLLIQGRGGRAADWGSIPTRLAQQFEVITFDNCGGGTWGQPAELSRTLLDFLD